jgi:branched-chain amino acid transport system ATP-binding protein
MSSMTRPCAAPTWARTRLPEIGLVVENAWVRYGATIALAGVTVTVGKGEAVAVLGANGAGKTTLANAISGVVRLAAGNIRFDGEDLSRKGAHRIARSGLLQVPEGRGVFRDLSVRENLVLGGLPLLPGRAKAAERIAAVLDRFPALGRRYKQAAGSLSGGEQQMLVLARALIAQPRLLILDEPSLGLAPYLVRETFDLLASLKAGGLSMLVIEQNLPMSLKLADRAYVLANGSVVISGKAGDVKDDPRLVGAYLGGEAIAEANGDSGRKGVKT